MQLPGYNPPMLKIARIQKILLDPDLAGWMGKLPGQGVNITSIVFTSEKARMNYIDFGRFSGIILFGIRENNMLRNDSRIYIYMG